MSMLFNKEPSAIKIVVKVRKCDTVGCGELAERSVRRKGLPVRCFKCGQAMV